MGTFVAEAKAAPEVMWRLVGDVERWPELLPTVTSVRRLDGDGSTGVGSRFEVEQPGLRKAVYEITDWTPGHGFTWVAALPGVTTTAAHLLEPDGAGTRLTLTLDWSGPLAAVVGLLFGRKARGMVESEAATFVALSDGA